MKWLLVVLLVVHGLIHLMGPAKAFGLADLPQLTQPLTRAAGVGWLLAAIALIGAAVAVAAGARSWWLLGLFAVVLSQAMIIGAWGDAKAGTVANVIVLAAVVYGFASEGPLGFRAHYEREVSRRLATTAPTELVTEADLARLPAAVQRYLRVTGAVGQPRVQHVRVGLRGRIRGSPDERWMEFTAEQHDFVGEPARFFLMRARRGGLPVHILHAYHAPDVATMRVRLLGLFSLVDMRGAELRQAETVTVFNDLSLFAPGALIDKRIEWEEIDARTVRGRFTTGPHTVTAELVFNEGGELADWISDDRLEIAAGKAPVPRRWSTPTRPFRAYGPHWLASGGEGRWHTRDGDWSYIELEMIDHEINGRAVGDSPR